MRTQKEYVNQAGFDKLVKTQSVVITSRGKDVDTVKALQVQVNALIPCDVRYQIEEYEGRKTIEYADVIINYNDFPIKISYNEYKKKYSLWCEWLDSFENLSGYAKTQIKQSRPDLKEPNEIGVLTLKKILEWCKYYQSLYRHATMDASHFQDKENFRAALDSESKLPNVKLHWYNYGNPENKTRGRLSRNGIVMEFEICEDFVSTTLKIDSVSSSISSFHQLSNNDYVSKD